MEYPEGTRASHHSVDARIARAVAVRHGTFSHDQALRAGATPRLIHHRIATGRWELPYVGVYRLAGSPATWRQALLAACLAAGVGAAASHRPAAAIWQLPGGESEMIEVSIPRGRRVRRQGILVHQTLELARVDLAVRDAISVTSPTRTLIDIAAVLPTETLEEALDDARRRRLTTVGRIAWRAERLGARKGIRDLRELVAARAHSEPVPESVLETRFLRLLHRGGPPGTRATTRGP